METLSCSKKCDGIFKRPTEVLLSGCNTLANKDADARSPDEYLQVLINDGFTHENAVRVVEARYGVGGTSFKQTMQRIFESVPRIYGFDSIGPSGRNAQPRIENYLKAIPDYQAHLAEQESLRNAVLLKEVKKWEHKPNLTIKKAFTLTAFAECSGYLEIEGDDTKKNICFLRDPSNRIEAKVDLFQEIMTREDYIVYLPILAELMDGNEFEAFAELSENTFFEGQVLALIKNLSPNFSQLDYAKLALNMNWMTLDEFKNFEKVVLKEKIKYPVTIANKDAVCSYTNDGYGDWNDELQQEIDFKSKLESNDVDLRLLGSKEGLELLSCLNLYSAHFSEIVFQNLTEKSSDEHQYYKNRFMIKGDPENKKYHDYLSNLIKSDDFKSKILGLYGMSEAKNLEKDIVKLFLGAAKDKRKVKMFGYETSPSEQFSSLVFTFMRNNSAYNWQTNDLLFLEEFDDNLEELIIWIAQSGVGNLKFKDDFIKYSIGLIENRIDDDEKDSVLEEIYYIYNNEKNLDIKKIDEILNAKANLPAKNYYESAKLLESNMENRPEVFEYYLINNQNSEIQKYAENVNLYFLNEDYINRLSKIAIEKKYDQVKVEKLINLIRNNTPRNIYNSLFFTPSFILSLKEIHKAGLLKLKSSSALTDIFSKIKIENQSQLSDMLDLIATQELHHTQSIIHLVNRKLGDQVMEKDVANSLIHLANSIEMNRGNYTEFIPLVKKALKLYPELLAQVNGKGLSREIASK
ncbi:MAG: hypothetical protein JNM93_03915 [Bacteriovoracaceae bacterium]|nr:hypothetical protein [Bacteriovoracaceae bacterium]